VKWNRIEEAYYLDVYQADGEPILYSVKLVLGAYLGRASTHALFRRGVLVCRPQDSDRSEARFDDLGTRVQLWYFTIDDLAEEILGNLQRGGPA